MLNKKKIFIYIFVLLVILSLSVLSVLAFEFRQPVFSTTSVPNAPSLNNVQDLMATLQYQIEMNMGSTLGQTIYMLCYTPDNDHIFAIVSNADQVTVEATSTSTSIIRFNQTAYRLQWNQQTGFFQVTNSSTWTVYNRYVYYANFDYPETIIPAFNGFNSNATFGTVNIDTQTSLSYYQYIYDSVIDREERESTLRQEAQSEGESIGFEEGAEAGYAHGYDQGFESGKDEGYSEGESIGYNSGYGNGFEAGNVIGYETGFSDGYKRGEDIGYDSGFDDGYETGFSDGYKRGEDIGYESGYLDGYETGFDDGFSDSDFKKPGQIIAQFWRYIDTSYYQGILWFCTTEHNGIKNFRWCTEEEIYSHYLNCEIYDYVYETNLYFQKNPLEFHYFVPQVVRDESHDSGALSVENVEYRFVDLYNQRAVIELDIDHTIISALNEKYNDGIRDSNSLVNGVASIAKSPVESLRRALDFEIFGINVGAVAVGLVAILFGIWAYNKIRKLLPI